MPTIRKPRRPRGALLFAIALGGPVLAVLLFCSYIGTFGGNIRAVVPGRIYRSATLPPSQLDELIHTDHLKTVISLRGGDMKDPWYRQEAEVCAKDGVQLESVSLRASALPKPKDLAKLLALFDRSAYPMLVHCQAGS